jgi:hypothetical protein
MFCRHHRMRLVWLRATPLRWWISGGAGCTRPGWKPTRCARVRISSSRLCICTSCSASRVGAGLERLPVSRSSCGCRRSRLRPRRLRCAGVPPPPTPLLPSPLPVPDEGRGADSSCVIVSGGVKASPTTGGCLLLPRSLLSLSPSSPPPPALLILADRTLRPGSSLDPPGDVLHHPVRGATLPSSRGLGAAFRCMAVLGEEAEEAAAAK